jgi:hypothetical protein
MTALACRLPSSCAQIVNHRCAGGLALSQLAPHTPLRQPGAAACPQLAPAPAPAHRRPAVRPPPRSLLRHPHVIQFKEVFLTSEYICIAMEYATGGSLFHYVQKNTRLKEAVARWFFQQLIIGVDYCHKRGVANRDIKLVRTLYLIGSLRYCKA